jgi:succinyl-diaminopimelate desuccinylase
VTADAVGQVLARERPDVAVRRLGRSLVAQIRKPSNSRSIVLAGHLDTVKTSHDGPVRMEGDRVYGCGAADMKSGLALMLEIAARPGPGHAGITLVFYAGEEGPYAANELGAILREDELVGSAALAVCLEPSDNELQLGCAGSLQARVIFEGRSAHSARPWQGENSIHKAAALLSEVAATEPTWTDIEGLRFASVTSVTLAAGGTGRNVIPASFELNVNHRFSPGVALDQAESFVRGLVADRARVEIVDAAPSAMPHRGHPLVGELEACGVKAVTAKQAWTDVARFGQHGIAAVNFGPGVQAQAHQPNENTSVRQMQDGLAILRRWLARI